MKRPDGLAMGDWHMLLRRRACKIVRPQQAPHDRTPPPSAGQESNKGFTVTVSCPRAAADGGVDRGGGGRTGPPDSTSQDGTPAHHPKPKLTNTPQTRERPSHDQTPANKRPPPGVSWDGDQWDAYWALYERAMGLEGCASSEAIHDKPGMFQARTTGTTPPMPEKMRPRMRLRTEMDDIDRMAAAVDIDEEAMAA